MKISVKHFGLAVEP